MSDKRLEAIFNRRSSDAPLKKRFFKGVALDTITTRFFLLFLVFMAIPLFTVLMFTFSVFESQVDSHTVQQLQNTKRFYQQHLNTRREKLASIAAFITAPEIPQSESTFFQQCGFYSLDLCLTMPFTNTNTDARYTLSFDTSKKTMVNTASVPSLMQSNPELNGWFDALDGDTGFIHFNDEMYLVRMMKRLSTVSGKSYSRLVGFHIDTSQMNRFQLRQGLLSVWIRPYSNALEGIQDSSFETSILNEDDVSTTESAYQEKEMRKQNALKDIAVELKRRHTLEQERHDLLRIKQKQLQTTSDPDSKSEYLVSTFAMMDYANHVIEHMMFVMPLDVKAEVMKGYYQVLYTITLASIILSLVLALVGGRPITQPLLQLVSQVDRLSRSNLMEDKVDVKGVYEINELVSAFNRMLHRLSQEQRLRDEFVATLTHDLKVPLLAEKQTLTYLNKGTYGALSDEQQEVVSLIQSTNQDSLGLVNGLLEVYRYESGQVRLNFDMVDVVALLTATASELTALAQEKKINVIYGDREVDDTSLDVLSVLGDRVELKRVFQNIISNAISNTSSKGSITLSVQHAQACGADYIQQLTAHEHSTLCSPIEASKKVIVRIDDTGIGIAREDIPHLFSRFAASKGRNPMSIGLGLYNAYQVVEAHGGQLWVETTEGEGTSVLIALPEKPDADSESTDNKQVQGKQVKG